MGLIIREAITKDKFNDLTTIIELKKQVEILRTKADKWDAYEYWSNPRNSNHGAG